MAPPVDGRSQGHRRPLRPDARARRPRCAGRTANGDHSHCCACLGTGYCSDGFSYETTWRGAYATPGYVWVPPTPWRDGLLLRPGIQKATYMDEYDVLCLLIILYLVCSATLGILGCVWTQRRGHCSGQIGADAPDAVPLSDIEATTIANPLLTERNAKRAPGARAGADAERAPWEPMFTDNEAFAYATPAFPCADGRRRGRAALRACRPSRAWASASRRRRAARL